MAGGRPSQLPLHDANRNTVSPGETGARTGTGSISRQWFLVPHSPHSPSFCLKIFQQVKERHFVVATG